MDLSNSYSKVIRVYKMLLINYPTARNGATLQTLGAKSTSISSDSSVLKIESDTIFKMKPNCTKKRTTVNVKILLTLFIL